MSAESIQSLIDDENIFGAMINDLMTQVDKNNSNDLDFHEVKYLLEEFSLILGFNKPTEIEIEDVFKGHDFDMNGKISKDEFSVLIKRLIEQIIYHDYTK